jgi:PAS domain-containing protein
VPGLRPGTNGTSDLHEQTLEAIRQSEEKYRNLFDHSNDGIVIHSPATLARRVRDVLNRRGDDLPLTQDQYN